MNEDSLREGFADGAWEVSPSRDVLGDVFADVGRRRTKHRVRVGSACAVVVVVGLVVGGAAWLRPASSHHPLRTQPLTGTANPVPTRTTNSDAVLHQGDRVRVQGQVLFAPGKAPEICAPTPQPDILISPPPAPSCHGFGLTLSKADPGLLAGRQVVAGVTTGDAVFTGIYRGSRLDVATQAPATTPASAPVRFRVPCAAPAGGWKSSPDYNIEDMGGVGAYKAKHPDEVINIVMAHASARQPVLVVAVTDPAAARAALGTQYKRRLCVVKSLYTQAQVKSSRRALDRLERSNPSAGLLSYGYGAAPSEQVKIWVRAMARTPQLDALIKAAPAGLINLDTWMHRIT